MSMKKFGYKEILGLEVSPRAITNSDNYISNYRNSYQLESLVKAIKQINHDKNIKYISDIYVDVSGGYKGHRPRVREYKFTCSYIEDFKVYEKILHLDVRIKSGLNPITLKPFKEDNLKDLLGGL